jgi:RNA polymerase sigma-70 factor (ECF subfamily)
MTAPTREAEFAEFLGNHGSQLRHAFIARYGPDVGSDVMGDVAEYAWSRWDKVVAMENPSGWLYRVGQSRSRKYFRRLRPLRLPPPRSDRVPEVEPALPGLVAALPDSQRVAVLLTQAFGYTEREAAETIGVSPSTVHQNTQRGLERLRARMGVTSDV